MSTQQWKDKIVKDLKGADYEKSLFWQTGEGFSLPPFYRKEDLENMAFLDTLPGDFPFVRGNKSKGNNWLVNQEVVVEDIAQANAKALEISLKGVDSLTFVFGPGEQPSEEETEALLANIRADVMELNFRVAEPEKMLQIMDSLANKYKHDPDKIHGSVFCDPLSHFSLKGHFANGSREADFSVLEKTLKAAEHLPHFRTITVDGSIFHNSGSGIVSEMAFTLAMAVDYLTFLTDKKFDIDHIARHIRFQFAVGSNYFMEIAKFRALRVLWARIVNAYGIDDAASAGMHIHASSSVWNKTAFDPYVNMLRSTTEAMSAAIGGVDTLTVIPFDVAFEKPTVFAERIARNQQLILRGESYFNKVADPAAGSYYIENLTQQLIEKAWELFLDVDERGGYLKAFEAGFITRRVEEEARQKDMDIATRKKTVLGTNQYPNPAEEPPKFTPQPLTEKAAKGVLKPYRGAQAFEKLRLKTEDFARHKKRPVVWLFTYGSPAMRSARARFAANFFGCAGFGVLDNPGFETVDDGILEAKKAKADIVVICSSDEVYAETAAGIFNALKEDSIVVLAGYPRAIVDQLKISGMEHFIHVKSNLLEELKKYQQLLGIEKS